MTDQQNPFNYFAVPEGAEMGFQQDEGFNDQPMYIWWIRGGCGVVRGKFETRHEALAAWNNRAPDPREALRLQGTKP
jgi:hypothetical protein